MAELTTTRMSLRIPTEIFAALKAEAALQRPELQTGDHIQNILATAAIASGQMDPNVEARLRARMYVLEQAGLLALSIVEKGEFDEHLTLNVFRQIMDDPALRSSYETAVGGDAYVPKLPGKTPFNMHMGWQIKNAVSAHVLNDENGKPRKVNVKDEPIQSYTLLKL
ncbi:hypothetical protein N9H93_02715 [Rhizobiaceae bacterium]|nr:hypothetical protein [Rhizobiaceae bacterium]